jgi:hypothetical protein
MRLPLGKSTPAIRAKAYPPLSLPLFVSPVLANDSYRTLAANNFAFVTHFFY